MHVDVTLRTVNDRDVYCFKDRVDIAFTQAPSSLIATTLSRIDFAMHTLRLSADFDAEMSFNRAAIKHLFTIYSLAPNKHQSP